MHRNQLGPGKKKPPWLALVEKKKKKPLKKSSEFFSVFRYMFCLLVLFVFCWFYLVFWQNLSIRNFGNTRFSTCCLCECTLNIDAHHSLASFRFTETLQRDLLFFLFLFVACFGPHVVERVILCMNVSFLWFIRFFCTNFFSPGPMDNNTVIIVVVPPPAQPINVRICCCSCACECAIHKNLCFVVSHSQS